MSERPFVPVLLCAFWVPVPHLQKPAGLPRLASYYYYYPLNEAHVLVRLIISPLFLIRSHRRTGLLNRTPVDTRELVPELTVDSITAQISMHFLCAYTDLGLRPVMASGRWFWVDIGRRGIGKRHLLRRVLTVPNQRYNHNVNALSWILLSWRHCWINVVTWNVIWSLITNLELRCLFSTVLISWPRQSCWTTMDYLNTYSYFWCWDPRLGRNWFIRAYLSLLPDR